MDDTVPSKYGRCIIVLSRPSLRIPAVGCGDGPGIYVGEAEHPALQHSWLRCYRVAAIVGYDPGGHVWWAFSLYVGEDLCFLIPYEQWAAGFFRVIGLL